ncbi:hypothetical protein L3V42_05200 [Oceanobacillus sp. APA_J-5(13-2)]|nr:hypothetical protein [Oceanobacillus alkalisoli]
MLLSTFTYGLAAFAF